MRVMWHAVSKSNEILGFEFGTAVSSSTKKRAKFSVRSHRWPRPIGCGCSNRSISHDIRPFFSPFSQPFRQLPACTLNYSAPLRYLYLQFLSLSTPLFAIGSKLFSSLPSHNLFLFLFSFSTYSGKHVELSTRPLRRPWS